ncbi:MAG: hypothetical protein IPP79_20660 [Chitinophagaceae bacterium]|nr:hypothetical protein [Chitinophagaceae bacterium]
MEKHMKGRGSVPTFRVGRQPYGVLPIAKLQQTEFNLVNLLNEDPPLEEEAIDMDWGNGNPNFASPFFKFETLDWLNWSSNPGFTLKLTNLIIALKAKWNESVKTHIRNIDMPPIDDKSYHEAFMDILGLHPNAVQYNNRHGIGIEDKDLRSSVF